MTEKRLRPFQRNKSLESFLTEVNADLWHVEESLLPAHKPAFPLVFVMGPLRSGSTLLTQWLANTGLFAYPTNLLSRFYRAPIMGAKLQLLLADERYNFRDELKDFSQPVSFDSENGKTKGALAPNEFWYFWRRFLPFGNIDYLPTSELFEKVDTKTLIAEFSGMMGVFNKPISLKAMILNYNIDFLDALFEKAVFIHCKRDPLTNMESALNARKRQLGDIDKWYSFKIPEYPELSRLDPYEQVAGQIFHVNKAVEQGLENVAQHKKMTVQYEDFCRRPEAVFDQLKSKLGANGYDLDAEYCLAERFNISRDKVTDPSILRAYHAFYGKS